MFFMKELFTVELHSILCSTGPRYKWHMHGEIGNSGMNTAMKVFMDVYTTPESIIYVLSKYCCSYIVVVTH